MDKIVNAMPEISVVITTYNRYNLICEAIESVIEQGFTDYEIILIDDGSSDNTRRSLNKYKKPIRYIYQSNYGVSRARNTGINAAKGKFIAFLDSDDLWKPNKLSTQWNFFQNNPDSFFCYTREEWIRDNRSVNPPQTYSPGESDLLPRLLNRCFIGASSVMIRKKLFNLIGFFDEFMPVCEDLDLWLRIAINYHIYFIDQPLTIKRMGQWPQLSTSAWGMDRYRIYALEKLLKCNTLSSRQTKLFLSAINQKSFILAKGGFKHRNPGVAIKYGLKWLKSINSLK